MFRSFCLTLLRHTASLRPSPALPAGAQPGGDAQPSRAVPCRAVAAGSCSCLEEPQGLGNLDGIGEVGIGSPPAPWRCSGARGWVLGTPLCGQEGEGAPASSPWGCQRIPSTEGKSCWSPLISQIVVIPLPTGTPKAPFPKNLRHPAPRSLPIHPRAPVAPPQAHKHPPGF